MTPKNKMLEKLKHHISNGDIAIHKPDGGIMFELALFPAGFPWEILE